MYGDAGAKATTRLQDIPGPIVDGNVQVLGAEKLKDRPLILRLEMLIATLPTFVSVDERVATVPVRTVPKFKLDGFSCTAVPTPVALTSCGLLGALSAADRVAARALMLVGVNVTLVTQLAPGANELPQSVMSAKSSGSVPLKPMLLILSTTVP